MRLVGLDLGGTSIKAGAVTPEGAILAREGAPTGAEAGAEEVTRRLAALARALGAEGTLGLGSPGLIDREAGVVLECPNIGVLEGFPLRERLSRLLGLPPRAVRLVNDANAAALGEHWLGAGRGESDLMMVTLGTGVGGGLVLESALFEGAGGLAGEIGHVTVEPDGPVCGCGNRGCVEMLASATAARRRALELGLPRAAPGDLEQLAQAARAGDGAERRLLFEIGRDLGHGLAQAVTLLDLRCFVVGGGFGAACDLLEGGIRAGLAERSYGDRLAGVRILPAGLGADAGWIGAARLCLT